LAGPEFVCFPHWTETERNSDRKTVRTREREEIERQGEEA